MKPNPDPSAVLGQLPDDVPAVAMRVGRRWIVGVAPDAEVCGRGRDALATLDALDAGWWAGCLAYDLGRAVEQVPSRTGDDRELPDLTLARFDARLVLDDDTGTAWIEGEGAGRDLLTAAAAAADDERRGPACTGWTSSLERREFEERVAAARELITAGKCYQVNVTRRITAPRPADPVALLATLARRNPAPHLSFVRTNDAAIVSASPERFLRWRGREVETRPIKGTHAKAAALQASSKDHAENVMIVDLARNDLGRVCEFGSITVPALCALEAHPGLHHLVSTVRGTLRSETGVGDLVRATFPPASVTGAPKPRVLTAIEELEPVRRGFYCGAVGWIDATRGTGDLAVAIRTFTITDAGTDLGVGSGIVADSVPAIEWAETELKAARLLEAAGARAMVGAR